MEVAVATWSINCNLPLPCLVSANSGGPGPADGTDTWDEAGGVRALRG